MSQKIGKVAVLGAGVMGAQIAGHLANAGIPSFLFDISQELAEKGKDTLTSLKPAPLYKPKNADLVTPCNYDDHIARFSLLRFLGVGYQDFLDQHFHLRIQRSAHPD